MKIYLAADHAGFELKKTLSEFIQKEFKYEIEDCGAFVYDPTDDYPAFIALAAKKLSEDIMNGKESRACFASGNGQNEAVLANRFNGVRCSVFYGTKTIHMRYQKNGLKSNMIKSVRDHDDSNALSLASYFISEREAKKAVQIWLSTPFSFEERHERRIKQIDELSR